MRNRNSFSFVCFLLLSSQRAAAYFTAACVLIDGRQATDWESCVRFLWARREYACHGLMYGLMRLRLALYEQATMAHISDVISRHHGDGACLDSRCSNLFSGMLTPRPCGVCSRLTTCQHKRRLHPISGIQSLPIIHSHNILLFPIAWNTIIRPIICVSLPHHPQARRRSPRTRGLPKMKSAKLQKEKALDVPA